MTTPGGIQVNLEDTAVRGRPVTWVRYRNRPVATSVGDLWSSPYSPAVSLRFSSNSPVSRPEARRISSSPTSIVLS